MEVAVDGSWWKIPQILWEKKSIQLKLYSFLAWALVDFFKFFVTRPSDPLS